MFRLVVSYILRLAFLRDVSLSLQFNPLWEPEQTIKIQTDIKYCDKSFIRWNMFCRRKVFFYTEDYLFKNGK